ncbi:LCP family protein [Geitlerinema splendidum]|jgi:LCP family protein required for cell wall assembly|nr:LCP family protein [Geitlerinema splendidum]
MVNSKPRRRSRLGTALYVLTALVLVALIIWFGSAALALAERKLGAQSTYNARSDAYPLTAQAIESARQSPAESTPEPDSSAFALRSASAKRISFVQQDNPFATNTPRPQATNEIAIPPVNTAIPQESPAVMSVTPASPPVPEATSTPRPVPTLFIYQPDISSANAPTAIPTAVPSLDRRGYDLVNIALLGNDSEITGESIARTDTIIILSINRTTGTVSMLSLPRDLYVYIPGWTMQRINLAYVRGASVGWTDGGFGLLRQTLFYNFGINVHYYAMVNLSGFTALVDAVGGVNLTVDCAIEDLPLIGTEIPAAAVRVNADGYHVLPVGRYFMSGAEALWYARSRHNSIEFDRGRRQQQIIRAVWRQARDNGLLANLPQLYSEGIQYVETNLAFEDIIGLLPIALNLDPSRIEQFYLVRTYHTTPWTTPDGENVQLPNFETLRPLLEDFYTPPTESQVAAEGATIAVYNGSTIRDLDLVAAGRLADDGFVAITSGAAETTDYVDSVLIDYTGRSKGSSLERIARLLNINPQNIRIEPRADRTVDFEVILGSRYNSCSSQQVIDTSPLPADEP